MRSSLVLEILLTRHQDAPPGTYIMISRLGRITTSPDFFEPLIFAQVCTKSSSNPLKWLSRHGCHQERIANGDETVCMMKVRDICPQADTSYTIVLGSVQITRSETLELGLGLNRPFVGTSTTGTVSLHAWLYLCIQRSDVPVINIRQARIPKPSQRVLNYVNNRHASASEATPAAQLQSGMYTRG